MENFDLAKISVRELNQYLHHDLARTAASEIEILHPNGLHNLAVGLDTPVKVNIRGMAAPSWLMAIHHRGAGYR